MKFDSFYYLENSGSSLYRYIHNVSVDVSYVPFSAVLCRPLEPTHNFKLNPLFNPQE